MMGIFISQNHSIKQALPNGIIFKMLHKIYLFSIFSYHNKLPDLQTYITPAKFNIFWSNPIRLKAFNMLY